MMNENVKKLLKESMWNLATCSENEPNVVPVAFKDVTEDGKLVIGDVFLKTTLDNIKANNGKIAVSIYDANNLEGYQIKGTAGLTVVPILQSICHWAGILYKEDTENKMAHCQKCDYKWDE